MEPNQSELDYYMNKDVKIQAKKPAGRNYRPRRTSSDSRSSDEIDESRGKHRAEKDRRNVDVSRHRHGKEHDNRGRYPIVRSDRGDAASSRGRGDRERSHRSRSPLDHRERRREIRPRREQFNPRDKIIGRNERFNSNNPDDGDWHREGSFSGDSHRDDRHVFREERYRSVDRDDRNERPILREDFESSRDIVIHAGFVDDKFDRHEHEHAELEREERYREEIERIEIERSRRRHQHEFESRRQSLDRYEDNEHVREREMIRSESRSMSKRGLSPNSMEESEHSSRYRRELSPVSDEGQHGELKIHVSARGRWIESDNRDRDLSPVSDLEIDPDQGPGRRVIHDRIIVRNKVDSMNDVELVSDEESISDVSLDNLQNWDRERYDLEVVRSEREERHGDYSGSRDVARGHNVHREERRLNKRSRSPEFRSRTSISEHRSSEGAHSGKHGGKHGSDLKIKLPNICKFYNGNGCLKTKCTSLHVCRPFVLESCKFGSKCGKTHSFFSGQPFAALKRFNPDMVIATGMHQKIVNLLQRRILISCGRDDLLHVIDKKDEELEDRLEKQEHLQLQINEESEQRSEVSNRSDTNSRKGPVNISVNKHDPVARQERKDIQRESRTDGLDLKSKSRSTERDLSPVSVEEENWDKHERYEKVSDDGNEIANEIEAVKSGKQQLETVSSSGSEDGLDKPVAYPAPTPENIAVPIGINDPLVFNRPLGRNPTSYVGPMNRPPPSVPIYSTPLFPAGNPGQPPPNQNNQPLFGRGQPPSSNPPLYGQPLQQTTYRPGPPHQNNAMLYRPGAPHQDVRLPYGQLQPPPHQNNQPLFGQPPPGQNSPALLGQGLPTGMGPQVPMMVPRPGGPGTAPFITNLPMSQGQIPGLPGQMPNHLPSPDFIKHVIQNLPPPPMQNTFKNDNTPAIVQVKERTKKKSKSDIDPELKESIKTLWKFPNKSVVNMTIIEFVTETEAYKEEFIAEIVRILVTLDLPYVTMRKLISLIKEKVLVNIASVTNMKKILEMYPSFFKVIETVDSDDDEDVPRSVQIKANITLGFCEKHGFLPFAIGKCDCNALHLCKFYVLSDCPDKHCKFGHKLKTDHNINVLKNHKLHRLTGEELFEFMSDVDNRNKETIPSLCKYYTREKGCYKGNSMDHDSTCHGLHMCYYALKGKCTNKECERAHSIRDLQPHSLLMKFGLDPNELVDDRVLQMVCENMIEIDKSKSVKNLPHKPIPTATGSQKAGGILIDEKHTPGNLMSGSKLVKRESKVEPILNPTQIGHASSTKVPAVCKFYQNEMGCRKKDWGPDGKCHFLHICQYFVSGECKFGYKCKRSHDLFSGPAAALLREYNIHPEGLTVDEILGLLNNTMSLVEQPLETVAKKDVKQYTSSAQTRGDNSVTKETGKAGAGSLKPAVTGVAQSMSGAAVSREGFTSAGTSVPVYESRNIEDVIKQIMEERRVK